ncbi:hypothetical protein EVAR_8314_1 [Eumeta japonica]|uniref:Uncharacterized protein n=1 Tax=Eumeta variegata TaxID=151549 RepID=A0A4C1VCA5_EUMVA|nr:hypothetical protein EVAR_8314_1 [Eumeta japonica]
MCRGRSGVGDDRRSLRWKILSNVLWPHMEDMQIERSAPLGGRRGAVTPPAFRLRGARSTSGHPRLRPFELTKKN